MVASKKSTKKSTDTEIAVLQNNVEDLKSKQEKLVNYEVRIALTEQAIKSRHEDQYKILKNTEDIKNQQQEVTKTLSLLQQSHKSQWKEIGGIKEDVGEHKKNIEEEIGKLRAWTESRLKWLVVTFFTLVSVVTGVLSAILALVK